MKTYLIDSNAEAELLEALAWHEQQWKRKGLNLYDRFMDAFKSIVSNPNRYPIVIDHYRECVMMEVPYSIFYQEFPSVIWIAAIAHHSRRADYWRNRRPPDDASR